MNDSPHLEALHAALVPHVAGDAPARHCARWAAAVDGTGHVSLGTTIDSASVGLGTCATRVALARHVATANGAAEAVAVVAPDGATVDRMLCGLCRQTLLELAPNASLLLVTEKGLAPAGINVSGLLPDAFREFREG